VEGCIFCEIVAGRSEASFVYRDRRASAFMDIAQWTPGHLLVVPEAHATRLRDLDPETGAHLFRVAMQLEPALRSACGAEGINLHLADGEVAGQEIFHVHLHVIPRTRGDGFGLRTLPFGRRVDRPTLDGRAERIRAAGD
jgi:diadenosine tetraphosphate (Ap4A) HIT family hydrolase